MKMNIYSLITLVNILFLLWLISNYPRLKEIKLLWDSAENDEIEYAMHNLAEENTTYYNIADSLNSYQKCVDVKHPCIGYKCPIDMECHIYAPGDGIPPEPTCLLGHGRFAWLIAREEEKYRLLNT